MAKTLKPIAVYVVPLPEILLFRFFLKFWVAIPSELVNWQVNSFSALLNNLEGTVNIVKVVMLEPFGLWMVLTLSAVILDPWIIQRSRNDHSRLVIGFSKWIRKILKQLLVLHIIRFKLSYTYLTIEPNCICCRECIYLTWHWCCFFA